MLCIERIFKVSVGYVISYIITFHIFSLFMSKLYYEDVEYLSSMLFDVPDFQTSNLWHSMNLFFSISISIDKQYIGFI